MEQLSLSMDFWNKRDPLLRFVVHFDGGWQIFETEIGAYRFAKRRNNARVETVIL